MFQVYELKIKVYLKKDILLEDATEEIASYIDTFICQDDKYREYHNANVYKCYTFDMLYPFNESKIYKKDQIYTFRIRTIDDKFKQYIFENIENFRTESFVTLQVNVRRVAKRPIQKIYSISPVLIKNDNGYWRYSMGIEDFEKRIKDNLIKKYNYFSKNKIPENFPVFRTINFKNIKPVPIKYKNRILRGDKLDIQIELWPEAIELAYCALGVGIGENNSRGCGFVNCKYFK